MRVGVMRLGIGDGRWQEIREALGSCGGADFFDPSPRQTPKDRALAAGWRALLVLREATSVPPEEWSELVHPLAYQEVVLTGHPDEIRLVGLRLGRLAAAENLLRAREVVDLNEEVSRRALFRRPLRRIVSHRPDPVLRDEVCLGEAGCRECVDVCPTGALSLTGGRPTVGPGCDGCGLCGAVCPTGALALPSLADETLEGILRGLHRFPEGDVVLSCAKARTKIPAGVAWEEIPCLASLGPSQLLRLAAGAPGRVRLFCPEPEGCAWASRRDALRDWLEWISATPAGPSVGMGQPPAAKERPALSPRPRGQGIRRVVLVEDLAHLGPTPEPPKHGPGWPSWRLTVEDSCNLCGACVSACPTDALEFSEGPDRLTLRLHPAGCLGCERCAKVCPKEAVRVVRAPLAALADEPVLLAEEGVDRCQRCGKPLPSRRLRRELAARLGRPVNSFEYCDNCRITVSLAGGLRQG